MRIFIITFMLLSGLYAALLALGSVYEARVPEALVAFVAWPLLALYMISFIGVPGLLLNNGACGWGWCGPSLLGWIDMAIITVAVFAAISALAVAIFSKTREPV